MIFHAVFNKLFQNIIGQTDKSITVQINSSREQGAAAGKRFRFITIVDCRRYHTANTLRQSFGKAVSQNRIYTQRQMGAMLFAGADRQNSDRSFVDFALNSIQVISFILIMIHRSFNIHILMSFTCIFLVALFF